MGLTSTVLIWHQKCSSTLAIFKPESTHFIFWHQTPLQHTFPLHAHGQALLIAAVLAAIALALVHQTLLVIPAGVAEVFAHRSLEKTLAAFTAVDSIVLAWQWQEVNGSSRNEGYKRFEVINRYLYPAFSWQITQIHLLRNQNRL